jgi:Mg2+/Co2+ transporter CorB
LKVADELSIAFLTGLLLVLLLLSALFASTETALLSINRFRLHHRAAQGHRGAQLVESLLRRPDQLIGVILLGNTLVTVAAASVVTVLTLRLLDADWLALTVIVLSVVVLIFCQVAPKTYGALYPERLALPAAVVYQPLLWLSYPFIRVVNLLANGLLRLAGVAASKVAAHSLSSDELRTVLAEAGTVIPLRHQQMLLSILDLERITVDDIMVPRNEVSGIDITDRWDDIVDQLRDAPRTRMPVYDGNLDHIIGVLHIRRVARELARGDLNLERLIEVARAREPYYVPEGTTLNHQLVNFQQHNRRHAYVVDEYGDVQGLVTLEDILEEIVGDVAASPGVPHGDVHAEPDGSFVVAGSASIRQLNRAMNWSLPTDGPKTLNGLILEYLETIPEPGTSLKLHGYPIEVLQIADNAVRTVRVWPPADVDEEGLLKD